MGGKAKLGGGERKPTCGIVMPISEIDGCSEEHWREVFALVKRAASEAGCESKLVSDENEVGVIQKRIVRNLYECDLVVCDVSAKNPNVMFELGMRLAFDKPTIALIDDKTPFTFDTSPLEHVRYRRDLRHGQTEAFVENLTAKIRASLNGKNAESFLKSFGSLTAARIDDREVDGMTWLIDSIRELRDEVSILRMESRRFRIRVDDLAPKPSGPGLTKIIESRNEQANFLAQQIVNASGAELQSIVGVLINHDYEMIDSVFRRLEEGGHYEKGHYLLTRAPAPIRDHYSASQSAKYVK